MITGPDTHNDPASIPLGSFVAGRYQTQRLLGEGGFGAVFAALDRMTGWTVALKVISSAVLEMAGGRERFRREVDVVRGLSHPNIVRVLDAGLDGRGTLYIAFELLEGVSVEDEVARRGAMPPRRVASIALQTLDALAAAHGAGIIHRDIKPANIFLVGSDQVKLLDFGIAKSINPNSPQGLTANGMMLGTPAYMAPEQLFGKPVAPTTDLFALGIVLAEMLAGRALYADDVSPLSILQERISLGRVPVPDVVLQTPLGDVITRALAMEASQRYQSAREMRDALQHAAARLSQVGYTPASWQAPARSTEASSGAAPPAPWMAPPQPTLTPRKSDAGMIGIVILLVALACAGVATGIYFAVFDDQSASTHKKKPAKSRDDDAPSKTGPIASPPPTTRSAVPQPTPPPPPTVLPPGTAVSNPAPLETPVVQACPAVASLTPQRLRSVLGEAGLHVDGDYIYCAGDMVNFRCLGAQGNGFTVSGTGTRGAAALMHDLPMPAEQFARKETSNLSGSLTEAYGGNKVLRLEMPAADAKRVLDRLCK